MVSGRWSSAKFRIGSVLSLVVALGMAVLVWQAFHPVATELWRSAQVASERGQWNLALSFAERAMQNASPSANELALAGIIALHAGQVARAEELFALIPEEHSDASDARLRAGFAYLSLGLVTPAEREFRLSARLKPRNREAGAALGEILRLSGRYFELESVIPNLIITNSCPSSLLFPVTWPDNVWLNDVDGAQINGYLRADSEAEWVGMALTCANVLTAEARDAALQTIRRAALKENAPSEAFARWGKLLVDSGVWDKLAEWETHLTQESLKHPQVWYTRGLWQLRQENIPGAIRSFWEVLERSPFHAGATYQLSQLLPGTSDFHHTEAFVEQARLLSELRKRVVLGNGNGGFPGVNELHEIVEILSSLGRDWEVLGWCQQAADRHPELQWPRSQIDEFRKRLQPNAPWIPEDHRISRRVRLDHYPLPDFGSDRSATVLMAATEGRHEIQFNEVAGQLGLNFRYSNGSDISAPQGLMYEISGGGVGVLDYDLDGWPDLYLSEGGPALSEPRNPQQIDRLFRNQLGKQVDDVTAAANLCETGYGQGVAVSDINSDGFPDIFVANIGPNQLWINQGDGTFFDATTSAGLSGSVWTMSAVAADLNGDGFADLFEANYLGGDALRRSCRRNGIAVQCRPSMFPSEPNRLWLNLGDGRFEDATQLAGIHIPGGKSMAVVAADFEGRGRLDLYVANDMESKAYYRNEGATRGDPPRFVDAAVSLGLAFGENGQPLASMGIAIDDVNQDGKLDVFVTNFLTESSNLYIQDAAGMFTDRSRHYAIFETSSYVMGWGTQFIDADLDGYPDLIVANGHLEDYRRWNIASRMPTHFYHNRNGHRFDLLAAEAVGSYFQKRFFGRTIAKFDGNRDGREDVIVTHVDAPIAWLQNASRSTGHFLAIRLIGTTSERDAIGTRLAATAAGRTWWKQLSAGDGFQASNQHQVVFGIGAATIVDELEVDWPSGLKQRFVHIPADREIILLEGRANWSEIQPP